MPNIIQRVAGIHDMSGFGKASLTIVIPTLSAMGLQVCPLPTAILSTHTGGFNDFTFLDLTEEMKKIVDHWKALSLKFDGIYSGFLGSPAQVDIVTDFIDHFRSMGQIVMVDPVMADEGELYTTMGPDMVAGMKRLVAKADVVTPNLTELAFLVGKPFNAQIELDELKEWIRILAACGPKQVVVTSVPVQEANKTAVVGFDIHGHRFWMIKNTYHPVQYPGTGDTFASVLLGCLMRGENLPASMERAVKFVSLAIGASFGFDHERREGPVIEAVLHTLKDTVDSYEYQEV